MGEAGLQTHAAEEHEEAAGEYFGQKNFQCVPYLDMHFWNKIGKISLLDEGCTRYYQIHS